MVTVLKERIFFLTVHATARVDVRLFSSCLLLNLFDNKASFRSLDDNGDGADCVSSFDETAQMLSHAGVDGALERSCAHLFLFCVFFFIF